MGFEKTVPLWEAAGTEPPSDLKKSGFTAGYKPPADFFNWFWYGVSQCLQELQAMTPADIGAMENATVPIAKGGTGATSINNAVINLLQKTMVNDSNQVNANTMTATGIYRCYLESTDPTTLNFPAQYGTMFIFGSSGYYAQLFVDVGAQRIYYRSSVNGGSTWVDWRRAATLTELETGLGKKANAEHKHAAGDITSGELPISRGGTGASSINDALINLMVRSIINADNQIDANAITGIGIYRIYFGDTSFDNTTLNYPARYGDMFVFGASSYVVQLFVDVASHRMYFRSTSNGGNTWGTWKRHATLDSSGALPVANGGTGATDAATALNNLGAFPKTGGTLTGTTYIDAPWGRYGWKVGGVTKAEIIEHYGASDKQGGLIIRVYSPDGSEYKDLTLDYNDDAAIRINNGGTGATTAAQALKNLGVIYSATEPTYQAGAIWLKPVD